MTETLQPTKTVFTVSQFLDWQKQGTLDLSPIFQRRHVWKAPAKSLLIDSVVRGFPIPIILLRQVQDLDSLSIKMEVIDGQQRLRTLLAFIDPSCLGDYDNEQDSFRVKAIHNQQIADKKFSSLSDSIRQGILAYELSTHVFPATTGDATVFRMFARLNSTGLPLSKQEIRNAEFHGAFKSLVYDLSFEYFDQWRDWRIFPNAAISRMAEAEAVSEYLMAMINGISGKSQPTITKFYKDNDDRLVHEDILRKRFDSTMRAIDKQLGEVIPNSAFRRPALFYSLFTSIYDHIYGLGSPLKRMRARLLPRNLAELLRDASDRIRSKKLPDKVQDAMDKATANPARRVERNKFLMEALDLEPVKKSSR